MHRLHPDRLLPPEPGLRRIARTLYEGIADLPIVSPHGHVEAAWFRDGYRFPDAATLMVAPDHYVLRMLISQGLDYPALGVPGPDGASAGPREVWRTFAGHYPLFRGTPTRLWLDHALHEVLELPEPLLAETAERSFDHIAERLASPEYTPRALYDRFRIEVLASTDAATDTLEHHAAIAEDPWAARIIPTFRPDAVTDPEHEAFAASLATLAEQTGRDVARWPDYLAALQDRRAAFRALGATATDHGVPTPETADLPPETCQSLLTAALAGTLDATGAVHFRAQMLTEMAAMSAEDGLVMQIHAGARRNYAPSIHANHGRDRGFDLPMATDWSAGLKPLLDRLGFAQDLRVVLYTLDEASYGRDLAPLAGAFPTLRLGAPWWFFDSPLGLSRHFEATVETAGFANLAGFVDDTRAFLSIPARHDMYRRAVASFLAGLVARHQLGAAEAAEVAADLAVRNARDTYRLGEPDDA
ncbi:MAG: glucuronate isomerase [Pseudomonadota bacterium]